MKILIIFGISCLCLVCADLNLQDLEIPDIDDFVAIKEKCDKLGGNETFEKLKASKDTIQACFEDFVDVNKLKTEVEESKKTGSMDEVFGKYCAKRPKLGTCLQGFVNTLRLCLNDEEKKALNTTLDVLKQLGDFACFRDGDRIAMFIAEGGVECIKDHTEGIQNCVNSTFKIDLNFNKNSLPNVLIDKKKCDDLGRLQNCVVEELEKCKDSTPANVVDSLFRFIKRSACTDKTKRSIHRLVRRSTTIATNFYNTTEARNKLLNLLKKECAQNAPEGGYEAFSESLDDTTQCVRKKFTKEPFLVTPLDKFKENMKLCCETFIEKTRACLSDDDKYWPQFQFDAVYGLIDWFYKNKDNDNIQRSRMEIFNCFQNFKQEEAKNELINCFKVPNEYDDIPDKKTMCSRFENGKNCVNQQLKKRCIQEVTIAQLNDGFFTALMTPCNKN